MPFRRSPKLSYSPTADAQDNTGRFSGRERTNTLALLRATALRAAETAAGEDGPVDGQEESEDEHRPKNELVGWKREDDRDREDPEDRDGVDECRLATEAPGGGLPRREFATSPAAVAQIQVDRNPVGQIECDCARGGQNRKCRGAQRDADGQGARHEERHDRGARARVDCRDP